MENIKKMTELPKSKNGNAKVISRFTLFLQK
jgi:hypothetical protein